jgi:hypothetical protein
MVNTKLGGILLNIGGRRMRLMRAIPLVVASTFTIGFANGGVVLAADTPSLGNRDCWQAGTPTTCVSNHVGKKGPVHFRAIDQFSGARPGYKQAAVDAVSAWNLAQGPQYYSFTPYSGDIWTYLKVQNAGGNGQGAFTQICDYITKSCSSVNQPYDIWYSSVYMNTAYADGFSYANLRYTWGHERAILWASGTTRLIPAQSCGQTSTEQRALPTPRILATRTRARVVATDCIASTDIEVVMRLLHRKIGTATLLVTLVSGTAVVAVSAAVVV